MEVKGLDGKTYKWNVSKYTKQRKSPSQNHLRARTLLKKMFPLDRILEELTLPGSGPHKLYADFYLPQRRIMVEVHGRQHTEYVHHFHKNRMDFFLAQARDVKKREWCAINDIIMIELYETDNDDEWERTVLQR